MDINWTVLLVTVITLVVLLALIMTIVLYVRHWADRNAVENNKLGEGKYFSRYVTEKEQAAHVKRQAKDQTKKNTSIQRHKKIITGAVVAVFILGTVTSLYMNRDSLQTKVTLSDEELKKIPSTRHQFENIYPESIPSLKAEIQKIKPRGLVLVGSSESTGDNSLDVLKIQAKNKWEAFGNTHQLMTIGCDWADLPSCEVQFKGWMFVLLPDYWQLEKIDQLLTSGASVLIYDAPFQVANANQKDTFSLYDLNFKSGMDKSNNVLALVGDRELSLGFDAGTIIDVQSDSHFYNASSTRPQALAIDSSHIAGSDILTRLYAKAVGKGRLVWMDFSPNLQDHDTATVDTKYFNGVVASIFRYLNKTSYSAIATWPEGRPFAALIEEDTEDQFSNAERVNAFFAKNKYPITWYMLSNEAQKNRAITRAIAKRGEVACHGDNHRAFTRSDERTQHERIALCRKTLHAITGKVVTSFRPPEEKYSGDTLNALLNNDITDFIAERAADRFVPITMKSLQSGKELISIPRMVSDDFVLWDSLDADHAQSQRITSQEINYVKA
ncbi:MAG: polysaccharide deacetylase family protein, partial [Thiotrichaceae bacterium]